jgi:hypothetical protein
MEQVLCSRVKACGGLTATAECASRLNVSVACENERKECVADAVFGCVAEMYLTSAKLDYLSAALSLPAMSRDSYKILLHTLVAFDRDAEKEIIWRTLRITDNFALDGFFNFRLAELKKRWNDVAALATNNSAYLNDDATLNELLKFLLGAVSPKIMRLDVSKLDGQYSVKGRYLESPFEYRAATQEQLMIYIINIAPVELTLRGGICDDKLIERLAYIFDVKSAETPSRT